MIQGYVVEEGRLRAVPAPLEALTGVIWIDLLDPTDDEERAVETALGLEVPTREEMAEIEDSSRLYAENGAVVMTANLPVGAETEEPMLAPVTFILIGDRLVTLRYHEPRAFRTSRSAPSGSISAVATACRCCCRCSRSSSTGWPTSSRRSAARSTGCPGRSSARPEAADYQAVLRGLGRQGDLVAHTGDSLVSLERLFVFVTAAVASWPGSKDGKARLKTLGRDTRFLTEHTASLSAKLNFLLDATLGMISIEQNATIKIFSVAAVVFLPPTLIASIYGMNFEVMPELDWLAGYPFALGLMVLSAVVSYWFFKTRGWL